MNKEILINGQKISYSLRISRKARNLRLTIYPDGNMTATLPYRMEEFLIEKFILKKAEWILKKLKHVARFGIRGGGLLRKRSKKEYLENKKRASDFVTNRLEHFNQFYNLSFKKVSVKNQRTRWGSCSKSGNLNFNYKIIFLPERLADYIIVHEICHLEEFNHSKDFWNLVAKIFPDYRKIIKELRKF